MKLYNYEMANVIVLSGGNSSEREVSLRSGKAVHEALLTAGHQSTNLDFSGDFNNYLELLTSCDVVFPVLHGAGGEDGVVQLELEKNNIKFVGAGSSSSSLCFDKWRYKQLALDHGLLVPLGELVDAEAFSSSSLINNPFVLKPYDGGSSVDTLIVRNVQNLDHAMVENLFANHPKMLLEELISGVEITVGVLGDLALPPVEIIPPASGEFDYENKYNGSSQELCPPENVSKDLQKQPQNIALEIHKLCGCRDLSRSDFIITPTGKIYLLETNTLPGMTEQSLFPKEASVTGLAMPDLVDQLVKMALSRD